MAWAAAFVTVLSRGARDVRRHRQSGSRMHALLSQRLARRLLAVTAVSSLGDWVAFTALVAAVARMTGGSVFAVAIVTCARLVPSVVLGPLAAPWAGVLGTRRTLVAADLARAGALTAVAVAPNLTTLALALVALELAGALASATRESAISTTLEPSTFPTLNALSGVLSYGMIPVGGVVGGLALAVGDLAPFALAAACCLAVAAIEGSTRELAERPAVTRAARVRPSDGLRRVATAGPLREVTALAALGGVAIAALFSTGAPVAAAVLGSADRYGLLLGLVGAGALGGAVVAHRGGGVPAGLATAAIGASLLPVGGAWSVAGPVVLGAGAAVAYVATQARLQRVASSPAEFAAAFAAIKVCTAAALVVAPALHLLGGLTAVVLLAAGTSAAGSAWAAILTEDGPAHPGGRSVRRLTVRIGRHALRVVVGAAVRVGVRVRHEGELPPGGAVVASAHPSPLDGVLGALLDRRVVPVAKPQRHPVARAAIALSGAVVTGRGGGVESAVAHLRRGGLVWLAPEGGLSRGPILRPARTGAARMAREAGVPIVPMGLVYASPTGPRLRDWRPWRRPSVVVRLGVPIVVAQDADLAEVGHETMAAVARLSERGYARPAALAVAA